MNKTIQSIILLVCAILVASCQPVPDQTISEAGLAEVYADHFLIGTALNSLQAEGKDTAALKLVSKHFNSIVAENCMKSEVLQPKEGVFDFTLSDQLVELGTAQKAFIVGHTLVWHSQTPDWIFVNENAEAVVRDTLIQRMKTHIQTVVGRYKGRVHGWDVLNEALNEDGSLRESKWYTIIGPEYIELAFQYTHEADPEAELYYNDYNMYKPEKRDGALRMIKNLRAKGLKVHAIGMQAHYGLGMDVFNDIEASIQAFSAEGLQTMITELDVSVLPFPTEEITAEISQTYANKAEFNPYLQTLPDSIQNELANYYSQLFKLYIKHGDKVSRVTFWGVNDSQSWRNYWPIAGRTDYPLLFDRHSDAKPAFNAVIKLAQAE